MIALFEWSDFVDDDNCKRALPSCVMLSNQLADVCEMSLSGLGNRIIAFLQGRRLEEGRTAGRELYMYVAHISGG